MSNNDTIIKKFGALYIVIVLRRELFSAMQIL